MLLLQSIGVILSLQLLVKVVDANEIYIAENCDCGYNDPVTNTNWNELWHINFDEFGNSMSGNKQQIYKNKDFFSSDYTIPAKYNDSYARVFSKDNVVATDESLQLGITVNNVPTNSTQLNFATEQQIRCGGIGTTRQDFLYGSFRSYMRTTHVDGTVAGMFLYHPDGEIDIELLSSVKPSQAYFAVHPGLTENGKASALTHGNQDLNFDPVQDYHEYRFDWSPGQVVYFIDGVEKYRMVTNIPSLPSKFMFNHWTDGNPTFSQGPVKENAYLNIKNMTFFFNSSNPALATPKCISANRTCDLKKIVDTLRDKNNVYNSYLTGGGDGSSNHTGSNPSNHTGDVTSGTNQTNPFDKTTNDNSTLQNRPSSQASTLDLKSMVAILNFFALAYLL